MTHATHHISIHDLGQKSMICCAIHSRVPSDSSILYIVVYTVENCIHDKKDSKLTKCTSRSNILFEPIGVHFKFNSDQWLYHSTIDRWHSVVSAFDRQISNCYENTETVYLESRASRILNCNLTLPKVLTHLTHNPLTYHHYCIDCMVFTQSMAVE